MGPELLAARVRLRGDDIEFVDPVFHPIEDVGVGRGGQQRVDRIEGNEVHSRISSEYA